MAWVVLVTQCKQLNIKQYITKPSNMFSEGHISNKFICCRFKVIMFNFNYLLYYDFSINQGNCKSSHKGSPHPPSCTQISPFIFLHQDYLPVCTNSTYILQMFKVSYIKIIRVSVWKELH